MDKSKIKEIINISVPAIIESIVVVIIAQIDTKMISVLGRGAISAVSFTMQPKLIVFAVFFALGTALSFFVAKSYGACDRDTANKSFVLVLRITVILSIVLGVLLYFLAEPIMTICNRQEDTVDMSISFYRIIMGLMIFHNLSVILNSALRGIGKMKVTLLSSAVMGVVDIIFNYLLIEGHMGFPALGIIGDAYATVLGTVAACITSIIAIYKEKGFLSVKGLFTRRVSNDRDFVKAIIGKSGNIVFENIFTRIGFLISAIISSNLNSDSTDVYSVGMILFNYSFAFGDGLSKAALTLVGKSLGANNNKDIKTYSKYLNNSGIIISVILGIVFITCSRLFFGMFFDAEYMIEQGFYTSVIVAILSLLQIVRLVDVGVLRGLGNMKAPKNMATVCVLFINPICSFIFAIAMSLGIWGIWLASFVTQLAWYIMGMISYRKGLSALDKTN